MLEGEVKCDVELSLSAACIKVWSTKHGVRVLTEHGERSNGTQTADTICSNDNARVSYAAKDGCIVIVICGEAA